MPIIGQCVVNYGLSIAVNVIKIFISTKSNIFQHFEQSELYLCSILVTFFQNCNWTLPKKLKNEYVLRSFIFSVDSVTLYVCPRLDVCT